MISSKKHGNFKIEVVKKDGARENFNINKLVKSLLNSEVDYEYIDSIVSVVCSKIYDKISTDGIKRIVCEVLKEIDNQKGTKYAKNYQFKNVLKVRTSKNEFQPFDKYKIMNTLVDETGLDIKTAEKISNEIEKEIKKLNLKYLTAPMIRELVNAKLIEHGLEEFRQKHTRLGIPIYDIKKLINSGSRENANLMHNPESIHKWVADETMKQYALLEVFPKHIADAHMKGDIHLHDLEYAAIRPVCCQHDLRNFFMYGLKVDGTGRHTSVSKPAKHAEVAIQHAAKVLSAAQCEMSGGQSIDEFNIWLAPYMRGLPYDRIKQLMQMFIYEMNQIYAARGGQVVFSSINLELEVPDFLKDKPAVIAGTTRGTYGEYEEEVKMILEALVDVTMEGDAFGKPFLFPNFIVKLREKAFSDENKELMIKLHKLSSKWGLPYFINMLPEWQANNTNAMGCRTRLSGDWTGNTENDTLRTGNMQWYTLNLPRIAYEAGGDDDRLFEIMDEKLAILTEALNIKHNVTLKILSNRIMPFMTQKFGDEQYYRYDNTTKTFGFVGLNELLKYHLGEELHTSKEALAFGEKVIQHIRDYADNLKKETGLRWTVTQTPAESTAGRFARLDYKYYKDETKSVVNGDLTDASSLYYTNSSHVRVNSPTTLGEKIRIEEKFHPLCNGGHIGHFWNAEAYADPEVLMDITKKIAEKSNIGFWTYTKNLSICEKCGKGMPGLRDSCDCCGSSEIQKFSRITGYLQNVSNWNNAKRQELIDRKSNIPRI
ncbi:anaerobic ribonucleoside-triphosphate reductase [Methanothermococcus okinawensis]|uniref:Anaerobic ribonucleoside-triphosphate reductase n=1 Tax=Methanothermococcus okinawensis (strain DSM 14208 / JCM 11175 / IH1) TaxID=647113 RepID=F8AMP8_METOI|nr:anaerobic ribonucleoside-triphosphate reductase [Methanothermococcus okinawensis]AEH06879.1 anaerobic ribonucleoside-triphosphate reductase [Methanothermococcus okinawensis IH1]